VRRKTADAGDVMADVAADARITAAIKGKLVADAGLSSLSISVSTTDGLVTMSGAASSPENIQKAVQLAWDTDGVHGVVSTIQVKD
jgi:hyperosmotically inducible protein